MKGVLAVMLLCPAILLAQADSLVVEKMDGSSVSYPLAGISQLAFAGGTTSVKEQRLVASVLASFTLYQNYPNPFNPTTSIEYSLPHAGEIQVEIYDLQGRLIRTVERTQQGAGVHAVRWDSRTDAGGIASSGTYLCRVVMDGTALVRKMLLIK